MKVKKGFISNSSSSSFICCYATIKDQEKVDNYLKKFNDINGDFEVLSKTDVKNKHNSWSGFGSDWAGVFAKPTINEDDNLKYLIFESCGGAGDSDGDFCVDEDCFDMDYDVDFGNFEDWEREFINGIIEENGFIDIEVGYGAGRNG